MEKTYTFKHGELVFIITELGKLPYNQVCKVINYIDQIASRAEEPNVGDQINMGLASSQSE
jgi:hypothetical protein